MREGGRCVMDYYRCLNCGNIFQEDEIHLHRENQGEFNGQTAWETFRVSPCCLSDFDKLSEEEVEREVLGFGD